MLVKDTCIPKIIAMYLPQYHVIPENSAFWGEGFTDWVGVKNAKPLFSGHRQPKIPLNEFYYDLSEKDSIQWQIDLAKKYGVYGFGIYHYWFSSEKNLLTKPGEIILHNKELDMPFLFAWDNISWKRTWSKVKGNDWSPLVDSEQKEQINSPEILIEYILGDKKDWKEHFDYLLGYFQDDRYIKFKNKPVFLVYHYSDQLAQMEKYWDELARENGFDGIYLIYKNDPVYNIPDHVKQFKYEPANSWLNKLDERIKNKLSIYLKLGRKQWGDYDKVWHNIINSARNCRNINLYYGAVVGFDDTPRRGDKARILLGSTPEKFGQYMKQLIDISMQQNKEFLFLTAWNEWGESAYLEPDEENGYAYLEALKEAVDFVRGE